MSAGGDLLLLLSNEDVRWGDDVEVGVAVRKFFDKMGWYDGRITKITKVSLNETRYRIEFSDGEIDEWDKEELIARKAEAAISVGEIGWKFAEKFVGTRGDVYCSGEVIDIREYRRRAPMRVCKYCDDEVTERTLLRLRKLSKNQFGTRDKGSSDGVYSNQEDSDSDGDYGSDYESEEEVEADENSERGEENENDPENDKELVPGEVKRSQFWAPLIKMTSTELETHSATKSYAASLKYPMDGLEKRIKQLTLHGKQLEVVDWPSDDDVQELYNALRKIDPAFSTDVRSWS